MAKDKDTSIDENVTIFISGADINFLPTRNTFRRGDKYADLRPGDLVDIINEDDEDVVLTLQVNQVTVGLLDNLALELGKNNHGVFEAQRSGQIDINKFAGPLWLRNKLTEFYGADETEDESIFTVIEFGAALSDEE